MLIKRRSNKIANFLRGVGIRKGDPVMLMMRRRYEFWFCVVALHKIGAICVPASHLLTTRDIVYRNQAADIKMIVTANEDYLMDSVDESQEDSPSLKIKAVVAELAPAGMNRDAEVALDSEHFERPLGAEATCNDDIRIDDIGMTANWLEDGLYATAPIASAIVTANSEMELLHLTGRAQAGQRHGG